MINVKLIVPKLLSPDQSKKGNTQVMDLEYSKPVTVGKILEEQQINKHFLGFMVLNGNKNVNKNYLIDQSGELKLYIIMCGG